MIVRRVESAGLRRRQTDACFVARRHEFGRLSRAEDANAKALFPLPAAARMIGMGVGEEDVFEPVRIKAGGVDIGDDAPHFQAHSRIDQRHFRNPVDQVNVAVQIVTQTKTQPSAADGVNPRR